MRLSGVQVYFWDIRKFQEYSMQFANGSTDSVLCMDSDGQHLYSGTYDEKIHLWNVATGELLTVTDNKTGRIGVIIFANIDIKVKYFQ